MNQYTIKQNSFAACEEMRVKSSTGGCAATPAAAIHRSETVVCPKPRRLGLFHRNLNEPCYVMPLRWHNSHHQEAVDSKAGNELLDVIILAKDESGSGCDPAPYFNGSPPSRASNPLIQDARFGDSDVRHTPAPVFARANPATSPRKTGCVRLNFGNNPTVRVEGFDCLDRDRRGCRIPALA